jgi:hypothetical protein
MIHFIKKFLGTKVLYHLTEYALLVAFLAVGAVLILPVLSKLF